jgi:hypothetical protein
MEARSDNENLISNDNTSGCTVKDIEIGKVNFRFSANYDGGQKQLIGNSYLINNCKFPIGVEIKQLGLDKNGNVISVQTFWPASIENIQPGRFDFSLYHIPVDEKVDNFSLLPETVKVW